MAYLNKSQFELWRLLLGRFVAKQTSSIFCLGLTCKKKEPSCIFSKQGHRFVKTEDIEAPSFSFFITGHMQQPIGEAKKGEHREPQQTNS